MPMVNVMQEHELKNAYIGEYQEKWQPWANTVAYYPLTSASTVNDMSGNNKNLTNNWISFWEFNWVDCAYNASSNYIRWDIGSRIIWSSITVNGWFYKTGGNREIYAYMLGSTESNHTFILQWKSSKLNLAFWYDDLQSTSTLSNNTRYNICCIFDKTTQSQFIYINWVMDATRVTSNWLNISNTTMTIFNANITSYPDYLYWGISNLIIEDKARTAQEIADYYNLTKSNYGL